MPAPVRVVHFLNQFFAGIGGEEMANSPLEVREGAVGPGRALQQQFGDRATIVATVFSGDNWFTENPDAATAAFQEAITEHRPDVVIAGPAFNAGRYGLACGHVCKTAGEQGIPSVTAMFPENPGVLEYDTSAYIVPTGTSPADSPGVFESLARIALTLASGEALGPAETEGYLARGIRRPGLRQHSASRRAVDMLVTGSYHLRDVARSLGSSRSQA